MKQKKLPPRPEVDPRFLGWLPKQCVIGLLAARIQQPNVVEAILLGSGCSLTQEFAYAYFAYVQANNLFAGEWADFIWGRFCDPAPMLASAMKNDDPDHVMLMLKRLNDSILLPERAGAIVSDWLLRAGREAFEGVDPSKKLDQVLHPAFAGFLTSRQAKRVLNIALQTGNQDSAKKAVRILGRELTEEEVFRLGNGMIENKRDFEKTSEFICRHRLQKRLGKKFLASAIWEFSFDQIPGFADAMGCRLSARQLVSLFSCRGTSCENRIEIARALALKSARWRPLIKRALREARAEMLAADDALKADAYGQQVGKPLTVQELGHVIVDLERQRKSDGMLYGWQKRLLDDAIVLLRERLPDDPKAKPVKS